jgi:hypothetical protein
MNGHYHAGSLARRLNELVPEVVETELWDVKGHFVRGFVFGA